MKYIALLGGSFNPPHIAHFRMAQEVIETLTPSELLLVPLATPAHKEASILLPFSMRLQMLQGTASKFMRMTVSSIELERKGPSYTVDTLRLLQKRYPEDRLLFILGLEDMASLPTWSRWEQLLSLTDFAVLPRTDNGSADILEGYLNTLWPDKHFVKNETANGPVAYEARSGAKIWYIPQPVLQISSSLIRHRWLDNRSIRLLVPEATLTIMHTNAAMVRHIWQSNPI